AALECGRFGEERGVIEREIEERRKQALEPLDPRSRPRKIEAPKHESLKGHRVVMKKSMTKRAPILEAPIKSALANARSLGELVHADLADGALFEQAPGGIEDGNPIASRIRALCDRQSLAKDGKDREPTRNRSADGIGLPVLFEWRAPA